MKAFATQKSAIGLKKGFKVGVALQKKRSLRRRTGNTSRQLLDERAMRDSKICELAISTNRFQTIVSASSESRPSDLPLENTLAPHFQSNLVEGAVRGRGYGSPMRNDRSRRDGSRMGYGSPVERGRPRRYGGLVGNGCLRGHGRRSLGHERSGGRRGSGR